MTKWKWFSDEEAQGLDYGLMVRLDMARELCGFPIVITSGRRTEEQNQNAGGTKESSHLKGLAVDLAHRRERTSGKNDMGTGAGWVYADRSIRSAYPLRL